MDQQRKIYERTVYTLFDFLGELGGLQGAMLQIAQVLVFLYGLLMPDTLTMDLMRRLFIIEEEPGRIPRTTEERINSLEQRVPYKPAFYRLLCPCLSRNRREKKKFDDGVDVIEDSLDVVNFIRLSIMMKAALSVLFDGNQRLLLRHTKKFVLPAKKQISDKHSTTNDQLLKEQFSKTVL